MMGGWTGGGWLRVTDLVNVGSSPTSVADFFSDMC